MNSPIINKIIPNADSIINRGEFEITQEKMEKVQRYMIAVRYDDLFSAAVQSAYTPIVQAANLPQKITTYVLNLIESNVAPLREEIAKEVAKFYSDEELDAFIAFFESPFGQIHTGTQGSFMARVQPIAIKHMESLKPQVEGYIRKYFE
jgi:thiaminase